MQVTRCDQCKRDVGSYIHVDRRAQGHELSFGDWSGGGDFCDWKCVVAYAEAQIARTHQPPMAVNVVSDQLHASALYGE